MNTQHLRRHARQVSVSTFALTSGVPVIAPYTTAEHLQRKLLQRHGSGSATSPRFTRLLCVWRRLLYVLVPLSAHTRVIEEAIDAAKP